MAVYDHDKALECLKIFRDSIKSGDLSRAQEFLQKACKLNPSINIDRVFFNLRASQPNNTDLINRLFSSLKASQPKNSDLNRGSPHSPSAARRRFPASKPSTTYTIDQVNVVREIMKNKKDYYKILGLEKNSSTKDAHKAYRKLSLKVHPDKNKAPGAEEAFKIVSKAFQCLSNEESRKLYDRIGSKEPVYERSRGGGGSSSSGVNRNHGFTGYDERELEGFITVVICLVGFVLFVFLFTCTMMELNSTTIGPPRIYSLSMSDSYNYSFTTQRGVVFYVQSATFEEQHPPNSLERVAIERKVEQDYHVKLYFISKHEMRTSFQGWGYRRESPICGALKSFEDVLDDFIPREV